MPVRSNLRYPLPYKVFVSATKRKPYDLIGVDHVRYKVLSGVGHSSATTSPSERASRRTLPSADRDPEACGQVPDARAGEVPKAFVVRKDDSALTAESLTTALRARLAEYKLPREVNFVESIPRSPAGKILRRLLR